MKKGLIECMYAIICLLSFNEHLLMFNSGLACLLTSLVRFFFRKASLTV